MQVFPEELRVQRAVGEGIGRGLRDAYAQQKPELVPDYIRDLLARMEQAKASAESGGLKGERPADEELWSAVAEAA